MEVKLATPGPYEVLDYLETERKGETAYFLNIDLSTDINGMDLVRKDSRCGRFEPLDLYYHRKSNASFNLHL